MEQLGLQDRELKIAKTPSNRMTSWPTLVLNLRVDLIAHFEVLSGSFAHLWSS